MLNMFRSPRYRFDIKTFELDPHHRIPLGILYGYLQEAADMHATSLGFDSGTMLRKNLVWMLLRVHLRLDCSLMERQIVEVVTWPSKVESRFAYRDYRIFREGEAEPFGVATSVWILIDLTRNRPTVLADLFPPDYHRDADRAHDLAAPALASGGEEIATRVFPVRRSDIDLNGHVNNLHYVEWLAESVPFDVWDTRSVRELYVEFKKQVRYGETVTSRVAQSGALEFSHRMESDGQKGDILAAWTRWQ
jgi:acyl-ACP thioesterase